MPHGAGCGFAVHELKVISLADPLFGTWLGSRPQGIDILATDRIYLAGDGHPFVVNFQITDHGIVRPFDKPPFVSGVFLLYIRKAIWAGSRLRGGCRLACPN